MLYNFFGLKGPLIILCIVLLLLLLVYVNQNKILYIPRTPQSTKKSPTPLSPPLTTQQAGAILPSRGVTPRTWR